MMSLLMFVYHQFFRNPRCWINWWDSSFSHSAFLLSMPYTCMVTLFPLFLVPTYGLIWSLTCSKIQRKSMFVWKMKQLNTWTGKKYRRLSMLGLLESQIGLFAASNIPTLIDVCITVKKDYNFPCLLKKWKDSIRRAKWQDPLIFKCFIWFQLPKNVLITILLWWI